MKSENKNFRITQQNETTHIEIEVNKINGIAKMTLISLILISMLMPFLVLIYAFNEHQEIRIGYFVSVLIFIACAVFFLRLFLWNHYGKEVFVIENNALLFYNDYLYFKDNLKQWKFNQITLGYINPSSEEFNSMETIFGNNELCQFAVLIDNSKIVTSNLLIEKSILKNGVI